MFRVETIVDKVVELLPVWLLVIGLTLAVLLVTLCTLVVRPKRGERVTATDVPDLKEVLPAMEETGAVEVGDEGEGLDEGAGRDLPDHADHQADPRPDPVTAERRAPRGTPAPRGSRGPAAPRTAL